MKHAAIAIAGVVLAGLFIGFMVNTVLDYENKWHPYDSRLTFYGDSGKCDLTVEYRKGHGLMREITFEDIICDEAVSLFNAATTD